MSIHFTRDVHAGRRIAVNITLGEGAFLAHTANVPQLGGNFSTLSVDRVDNALPTRQSIITVNIGNTGVATGGDVIDTRTFRHYKANTAGRSLSVVLNVRVGGDILGRLISGHWRHHNAIGQFQTVEINRAQKSVIRAHVKNLLILLVTICLKDF